MRGTCILVLGEQKESTGGTHGSLKLADEAHTNERAMDKRCRDLGGCLCESLRCNKRAALAHPKGLWMSLPRAALSHALSSLYAFPSFCHVLSPPRYPPQGRYVLSWHPLHSPRSASSNCGEDEDRQLLSVCHPLPLLLASEQCHAYARAWPAS